MTAQVDGQLLAQLLKADKGVWQLVGASSYKCLNVCMQQIWA